MRPGSRRPLRPLAALVLLLALSPPAAASAQDPGEPTVVFLVRHAEKTADPDDPPLTGEGRERAELLARLLADSDLDRLLSTDYVRTRQTALPVSARSGLDVELYDPADLHGLAARLRADGGRVLVVGHSNTTPQLVEALGGEPGPPIREADEYDRLYVLTIPDDGPVSTVLLRFGRPFRP